MLGWIGYVLRADLEVIQEPSQELPCNEYHREERGRGRQRTVWRRILEEKYSVKVDQSQTLCKG
uniref:Uncharacterized protein n=1 Tax=Arion vulgaris TaxID=1028688 RepID=A0A0B6ZCV6_9EUPU